MHDVNLSAGRIWSFADDSGDTIRLSLPDVLISDIPLHHSPLPGYLAPIQHELLSSILQVAIDGIWPRGIGKRQYADLINSERLDLVRSTVQKICDRLEEQKGFSLSGHGAFLQMPTAWRPVGKKSRIARLMWPFIPNVQGATAKGLRRTAPVPDQLGPDLTALFLFTTCTLPKNGTRYWSMGNLAGRALLHQYLGKTLRQQLFQAVLPGYSSQWKPLQPLPWLPECQNNGGLEKDNRPPFAKYMLGKKRLQGTANLRFYLARAVILDPPEQCVCAVTGEQTTVFNGYRLLTDKAVHTKIMQCARLPKKSKAAGILTTMYRKLDHPSVAGSSCNDGQEKDFDLPYHGFPRPPWSMAHAWQAFPSPTMQAVTLFSESNKHQNGGGGSFFQVKYVARKQDARGLFLYQCPGPFLFDENESRKVHLLKKTVEQSVEHLKSGIVFLLRQGKKKKTSKQGKELQQEWLTTCSQQLWNIADALLYTEVEDEDYEQWQQQVAGRFQREIKILWQHILQDYQNVGSMSLADHQKECDATGIVLQGETMYIDLPYLESKPVVRAGRAFAKAYQGLGKEGKARLGDQGVAVYTSRHFWTCMNKARKEDPNAYQPMYEQILPLFPFIQPREDGTSLGDILFFNSSRIQPRRVEMLFSETDKEMLLDEVLQVFHSLTAGSRSLLPLDVGIFCYDLTQFHFKPDIVIRRWAYQYFAGTYREKEENHVQA